ncbi:SPASM domain-containing protein, partial [candidate division KSB1 bacterium]|nr:SPASM domain-containing protein [candidate division KSB1 bacterium]
HLGTVSVVRAGVKIGGDIPVVEHNGDFYSCDHFVDPEYHVGNIRETPLVELLESGAQRKFGNDKKDTLPRYCRECEVLDMCNGGCPKNRFINTPDGEPGLNYLCAGYKKFFNHCKPFVTEVAAAWHMQNREQERQTEPVVVEHPVRKIGRNDLCPCGSGKKYKHCCLSN